MNKMEEYAIELVEDVTKEGHSLVIATLNTLFKAHGGDLILSAKDSYFNERFKWRLEDFTFEEKELDDETIRKFYENISHKQLNYLFELFDKARTSTFDLHAKILSKIYGNLLLNADLDYYELSLISNINILNEEDFEVFYKIMNNHFNNDKENYTNFYGCPIEYNAFLPTDGMAVMKFINLGILMERKEKAQLAFNESNKYETYPKKMDFVLGEYSRYLYDILNDIYSK